MCLAAPFIHARALGFLVTEIRSVPSLPRCRIDGADSHLSHPKADTADKADHPHTTNPPPPAPAPQVAPSPPLSWQWKNVYHDPLGIKLRTPTGGYVTPVYDPNYTQ